MSVLPRFHHAVLPSFALSVKTFYRGERGPWIPGSAAREVHEVEREKVHPVFDSGFSLLWGASGMRSVLPALSEFFYGGYGGKHARRGGFYGCIFFNVS